MRKKERSRDLSTEAGILPAEMLINQNRNVKIKTNIFPNSYSVENSPYVEIFGEAETANLVKCKAKWSS